MLASFRQINSRFLERDSGIAQPMAAKNVYVAIHHGFGVIAFRMAANAVVPSKQDGRYCTNTKSGPEARKIGCTRPSLRMLFHHVKSRNLIGGAENAVPLRLSNSPCH
jgi:hypothetical protein